MVARVAGRGSQEELLHAGDYFEYGIGDESVLVVRNGAGELHAFHNSCLHRGTRLADATGRFDDECIQCPYHGWQYGLDGSLTHVVDREDFTNLPDDLALHAVRVETFGGFVFVNFDPDAEPLLEFLDPLPELLAPFHLDRMRLRGYRTTIIDANWKAVVDAFNEGYHVQGLHPQILPWTDDVSIAYEQFGTHARYGRLPGARRELRPSPRLGLDRNDYDEGEILAGLVAGLGGAFLGDGERARWRRCGRTGRPKAPRCSRRISRRDSSCSGRAAFRHSGLRAEQMTSAECPLVPEPGRTDISGERVALPGPSVGTAIPTVR